MKNLLVILLLLGSCKCTDEERTRRVLEDSGYTHVTITGRGYAVCGEDPYCTRFEALGPGGRQVSGAVGCGMGCSKGCTIRLD